MKMGISLLGMVTLCIAALIAAVGVFLLGRNGALTASFTALTTLIASIICYRLGKYVATGENVLKRMGEMGWLPPPPRKD